MHLQQPHLRISTLTCLKRHNALPSYSFNCSRQYGQIQKPLLTQTYSSFRTIHDARRWLRISVSPFLPRPSAAQFPHNASIIIRLNSTVATSKQRSRFMRFFLHAVTFAGFFGLTITGFIIAFFIYDASTYKESSAHADVPISELALHPKTGGPKNLPVADFLVDDEDDPERLVERDKPRLVVLGAGWGVWLIRFLFFTHADSSNLQV